jgi:hypothetical protein
MYENPAEHSIQGINLITLDNISEELLCEGDQVMPFSKFMEEFGELWKKESKGEDIPQIWYIAAILRRFHPVSGYLPTVLPQSQMLSYHMLGLYPWILR